MANLTFDGTDNNEDSDVISNAKKASEVSRTPKVLSELETHIYYVQKQDKKGLTIQALPDETRESFLSLAEKEGVSSRELFSKLLIHYGEDILDLTHLRRKNKK